MWFVAFVVLLISYWHVNSVTPANETANETSGSSKNTYYGWEDKLKKDLLKDYNSHVIPIKEVGNPVVVDVGLSLISVFKIDPSKHIFSGSYFYKMQWKDERLKWDPAKYGGVDTAFSFETKEVWVPDITLYNGFTQVPETLARGYYTVVKSDGTVLWVPQTKLKVHCEPEYPPVGKGGGHGGHAHNATNADHHGDEHHHHSYAINEDMLLIVISNELAKEGLLEAHNQANATVGKAVTPVNDSSNATKNENMKKEDVKPIDSEKKSEPDISKSEKKEEKDKADKDSKTKDKKKDENEGKEKEKEKSDDEKKKEEEDKKSKKESKKKDKDESKKKEKGKKGKEDDDDDDDDDKKRRRRRQIVTDLKSWRDKRATPPHDKSWLRHHQASHQFDDLIEHCKIKFGSWIYDTRYLKIQPFKGETGVDVADLQGKSEKSSVPSAEEKKPTEESGNSPKDKREATNATEKFVEKEPAADIKSDGNKGNSSVFITPRFDETWKIVRNDAKVNSVKYPCCEHNYQDITFTLRFKKTHEHHHKHQQ